MFSVSKRKYSEAARFSSHKRCLPGFIRELWGSQAGVVFKQFQGFSGSAQFRFGVQGCRVWGGRIFGIQIALLHLRFDGLRLQKTLHLPSLGPQSVEALGS